MIIYKNTAGGFKNDVDTNNIVFEIETVMKKNFGRTVSPSEKSSWQNSLSYMERVVRRSSVPDDCGILVEYVIPVTSNRVDFIISGLDEHNNQNFILIELKQWQSAKSTDKDGIVETFLGKGQRLTSHPSYQAYSYKTFLKDYNEDIDTGVISPYSCAVLHNYTSQNPEPLKDSIYDIYTTDSPIYFKEDQAKLEEFIKKHVGKGKGLEILYKIESGKVKPTKKLIDHVNGLFEGNKEFILLDEQKVAYEVAYNLAKKDDKKTVVIIKGGPGTGKSVISMNLLGSFIKDGLNAKFVAPNASFRSVIIDKLIKKNNAVRVNSLFKGSGGFVDCKENTFDVIVVDEAHRLKNKMAYMYQGENQIEDIIKASKKSIFFVDDDQVIRPEDIGSTKEINRLAEVYKAEVHTLDLVAQFRCSGAEGYINWLNDVLHIKQTANYDGWDGNDFDFKVFDNPNELFDAIKAKHNEMFDARLLAGYAWKWTSKKEGNKDAQVDDIEIPEFSFKMPWNSRKVGTTWAIDDSGINQVGCIHTSQGLEFDYVGIIVGDDLKFNPETLTFYTDWKAYKDNAGKKGLKKEPEKLSMLVRNIYKILMTRGMKGCYVYFMDKNTREYFKSRIKLKN